jgi:hypothetical protein
MGIVLGWFRRTAREVDRRIWLALMGVLICLGVVFNLPVQNGGITPQVLQGTLDAASTQANAQYLTLAAAWTSTPFDALMTGVAPTVALQGHHEIRQYAASARSDSERDNIDWGAVQAAGPTNTEICSDSRTAWSAAQPNGQASLTLLYPQIVFPTAILVHQTYNPGYITQVTITDVYGEVRSVYTGTPGASFQCPFVLVILIDNADYPANTVSIFVDNSGSPSGAVQIDGVELVGIGYN